MSADQSRGTEQTSRGFPAPEMLPDALEHGRDQFYVIRLSRWEKRHLDAGTGLWGKFALLSNGDGTYDLVRYAE